MDIRRIRPACKTHRRVATGAASRGRTGGAALSAGAGFSCRIFRMPLCRSDCCSGVSPAKQTASSAHSDDSSRRAAKIHLDEYARAGQNRRMARRTDPLERSPHHADGHAAGRGRTSLVCAQCERRLPRLFAIYFRFDIRAERRHGQPSEHHGKFAPDSTRLSAYGRIAGGDLAAAVSRYGLDRRNHSTVVCRISGDADVAGIISATAAPVVAGNLALSRHHQRRPEFCL